MAPDLGGFDKGDRPSAVTSLAAANSAMAASAIALSASLAPKIRAASRARPILVPLARGDDVHHPLAERDACPGQQRFAEGTEGCRPGR
ncbi:MAG TPA: hypothetical protein VH307_27455 [Streptosporangiaceae bacterium]|nr:hypothetical protein [Streptosporangiaceae bacterium]